MATLMPKPGNVFLALALAAGSLSAMQGPTDEARKKDIYAVYSLVIPRTDAPAGNEMYLIEQISRFRRGGARTCVSTVSVSTHKETRKRRRVFGI